MAARFEEEFKQSKAVKTFEGILVGQGWPATTLESLLWPIGKVHESTQHSTQAKVQEVVFLILYYFCRVLFCSIDRFLYRMQIYVHGQTMFFTCIF